MSKITIPKIRPIAWKVYAQGEEEIRYVRGVLRDAGIDATEPEQEPALVDPPLYAIVVAPKVEVPLTQEELIALLQQDDRLKLDFDSV